MKAVIHLFTCTGGPDAGIWGGRGDGGGGSGAKAASAGWLDSGFFIFPDIAWMRLDRRDLALAPVSVTGGALLVVGSLRTGDMEEGEEEEEEVSGGGGEGPKRGGGGWLGWEGGTWKPGEKLFRFPTTFLSTSLSIPIDIRPTRSVVAGLLTAGGMKILLKGFFAGRGSDSFGERIGGGGEPMDKSFNTSVLLASKLIPNFLVAGSF